MQDKENSVPMQAADMPPEFIGVDGFFYSQSPQFPKIFLRYATRYDFQKDPYQNQWNNLPDDAPPRKTLPWSHALKQLPPPILEPSPLKAQVPINLETFAVEEEKQNNSPKTERLKEAEADKKSNRGNQPTVMAFPTKILPDKLQRVVELTTEYLQFKPDWIGSSILYAASVAIGNCYGVKYNGWSQKGIIYLAIVGFPGTNKSAPPEYALNPLRQLNAEYYKRFTEEKAKFDQWERMAKKQRDGNGPADSMEPPVFRTLLVSDITPEGLIHTHKNNLTGLGLFMDELAGWFQNFNRYQKGSEQEFWLSNWSFTPLSTIRKTTAPVLIDQPFISIAGTIQPGVLGELSKDRRSQNGFIDRILFAFPDEQKKPHDTDNKLNSAVTDDYRTFLKKLLDKREEVQYDTNGNPQTQWIEFSSEAFSALRTWKNKSTDRCNKTENPALKGIYAKLEVYCIRFSLLIELLDYACDNSNLSQIQLASVKKAIELTEYFRQNAEKVYYYLNEQTAAEQLPRDQQRLFNELLDETNTTDAIKIGSKLVPTISESTVKRLLRNSRVFRRIGRGGVRKNLLASDLLTF